MLERLAQVGKPAPPPVPVDVDLHNSMADALEALSFPIYRTVPETRRRLLTGAFESPSVGIVEVSQQFKECNGMVAGATRSAWRWTARLRFNNMVSSDQILVDLAAFPIALTRKNDSNTVYDGQWGAYLTSVAHEWRPEQDPGVGSSFTLSFDVRPY